MARGVIERTVVGASIRFLLVSVTRCMVYWRQRESAATHMSTASYAILPLPSFERKQANVNHSGSHCTLGDRRSTLDSCPSVLSNTTLDGREPWRRAPGRGGVRSVRVGWYPCTVRPGGFSWPPMARQNRQRSGAARR